MAIHSKIIEEPYFYPETADDIFAADEADKSWDNSLLDLTKVGKKAEILGAQNLAEIAVDSFLDNMFPKSKHTNSDKTL